VALNTELDSIDDLPEPLREHYTQRDGRYVLTLNPAEGGALRYGINGPSGVDVVDANGLKSALSSERKAKAEALKQLDRFKSIQDPDAALEAMRKLEELGDLSELEDLDSKLAKRTEQLETKFEADKRGLVDKYTRELQERDERMSSLRSQLEDRIVNAAATSEIAKQRGVPELLLPVVQRHVQVTEAHDGTLVPRVVDAQGNERYSPTPGSSDYMSIAELVGELRNNETFARAFDAPEASGTGAQGSRGGDGASGGVVRLTREQARDPRAYRAAKERAAKAGGRVEIGS
jgi:hypothetical protein